MLRLAVFDLDGTLKQARDPYVYLHRHLGTLEAAEAFTERGLSGQIPYEEWLRLDVGLWKGTRRSELERLLRENPYVPGAVETVAALKARGVAVAIISTGPLLHAELAAAELGIGPAYGNEIGFEGDPADPMVSGRVQARVPFHAKGQVLEELLGERGIPASECIAVGDGVTDIPMFERAAVGIAVHPNKWEVAATADIVLDDLDLRPLLPRLHAFAPELW